MAAAERLAGLDAAFLAAETPAIPLHIAVLARLDPSTAPGGWSFGHLRDHVAARIHLAPVFRRRVVEVPLGLHHPVWADDPAFDLDDHLHRLAVDAPGGDRELAAAAAAALAAPLPRDRPLWALHVAEGLAGGAAAVLAVTHHAVSDGVSGTELLARLLDLQPEPWPVEPEAAPWDPPPLPTDTELLADALGALGERPAAAAAAVRATVELVGRLRGHRAGGAGGPVPFSAPRTALNVALSGPGRAVALAALALEDVGEVRRRHGVTVNDVVLAVVAGALRDWLAARGEVPAGDLVALVPASRRTAGDVATLGNRVSPMLVSLATTVAHPVERLAAIAASARAAKDQERSVGSAALGEWAEAAPPLLVSAAAALASSLRLAEVLPPLFNVSVSNVPGPPVPLYLAGAAVTAAHPLGPVADGGALNVTVLSYAGTLWFGLVADPAAAPGLDRLAAALPQALAELGPPGGAG